MLLLLVSASGRVPCAHTCCHWLRLWLLHTHRQRSRSVVVSVRVRWACSTSVWSTALLLLLRIPHPLLRMLTHRRSSPVRHLRRTLHRPRPHPCRSLHHRHIRPRPRPGAGFHSLLPLSISLLCSYLGKLLGSAGKGLLQNQSCCNASCAVNRFLGSSTKVYQ